MASVMAKLDKLLGPIAPNKQAAKTGGRAKHAAVFTASGDQGRSVCESLINDGMFVVTGITLYPHSQAATALRNKGVNIVKGDIGDPATYSQYLEGKDCAFVNADFLNVFRDIGPNTASVATMEVEQSVAAIDACQKAGIKHIVYSALDDLPEGANVPHFTSKATVVKHIQEAGIPATILYPSHPFSDIHHYKLLNPSPKGEEHGWILSVPAPDETTIPGYAVEQIGDWVKVAMQNPKHWIGKDMHACGERITIEKMAHDLEKIARKPVQTLQMTKDQFYSDQHKAELGEPLWAQYRACLEHHFTRDEEKSAKVAPHQWRFRQWALQDPQMKLMLHPKM